MIIDQRRNLASWKHYVLVAAMIIDQRKNLASWKHYVSVAPALRVSIPFAGLALNDDHVL